MQKTNHKITVINHHKDTAKNDDINVAANVLTVMRGKGMLARVGGDLREIRSI